MVARWFLLLLRGLGVLVGLAALDYWLFAVLFDVNYLEWYLDNGALIGLFTAVFAMAWGDINRHTGLISANPLAYLGENLRLVGLAAKSLGASLTDQSKYYEALGDRLRTESASLPNWPIVLFVTFASLFQGLIALVLQLVVGVGLMVWLVLITPLQYFVYLFCGAPAREMLRANVRTIARYKNDRLEVDQIGREDELEPGWWDASFSRKPVSMTSVFASLLFLFLRSVL